MSIIIGQKIIYKFGLEVLKMTDLCNSFFVFWFLAFFFSEIGGKAQNKWAQHVWRICDSHGEKV